IATVRSSGDGAQPSGADKGDARPATAAQKPPAEQKSAPEQKPAPAPAPAPAKPAQAAVRESGSAAPEAPGRGGKLVPLSQIGTPTSYRPDLAEIDEPGFSRAHAGPSVRKFARELAVDLAKVKGTGFKGRITHEDVKAFVKRALSAPAAAPAGAPAA